VSTDAEHLTYYGDPDLKARLVANMRAHREADRLTQGNYFDAADIGAPAGCAIGCTVADILAAEKGLTLAEFADSDDRPTGPEWREEWSRVTGLPIWLAAADDNLFELQSQEAARDWPVRLLEAVPVGVDLGAVHEKWSQDWNSYKEYVPDGPSPTEMADRLIANLIATAPSAVTA
jgi:hypothetical protein